MTTTEELLGGFTYAWICNNCKHRECIQRTDDPSDKPKSCAATMVLVPKWKRAATGLKK